MNTNAKEQIRERLLVVLGRWMGIVRDSYAAQGEIMTGPELVT